jgi:hypothetical protein
MDLKTTARYAGLATIITTHAYMLNAMLPEKVMKQHAVLNLVSAGLIIYSLY